MGDSWKVTVDPRSCVRTGLCAASAPKEFRLDENGQGRATADTLPASEEVLEVAESCPMEAITVVVAGTDEAVFPPDS
ncbi:ferredoxin [Streptomyces sp. NPDC102360]|uniref:ferredoxin n=1 Tax=Streptomyces sp. NPDC102360 TaxID=3366160 RepID=UPI00380756CF